MSIVQSTHQPIRRFFTPTKRSSSTTDACTPSEAPKDVITKELVSTIYDVDVEVNSLYGDKVRVCVPVREIER